MALDIRSFRLQDLFTLTVFVLNILDIFKEKENTLIIIILNRMFLESELLTEMIFKEVCLISFYLNNKRELL